MRDRRLAAVLARAVLALELAAVASWSFAAALYPGGSQAYPREPGHSFWLNYLCDLADGVARDGEPNAGAIFGRAGMVAMIAALALAFAGAPLLFRERPRTAALVRLAGLLSAVATAGVPIAAALDSAWLHRASILIAGPLGLVAVAGVVHGARGARAIVGLGGLLLASALFTLAVYVHHVCVGASSIVLPVAQRLSLLALLAWTALVAERLRVAPPVAAHASVR